MTKYSIKHLLLDNHHWWNFYNKHEQRLRKSIVVTIAKLLSCKTSFRGSKQYACSNPNCHHTKHIHFTCKSKACSSCSKKATEIWINKQNQILPNTHWQHITFTMPDILWDFFWYNRELLNLIAKLAANCILKLAKKRGFTPGIFIAIHKFGRDLKRNVHIHASTTQGGIDLITNLWKKGFFQQKELMKLWRYNIVSLFRSLHQKQQLIIPASIKTQLNNAFTFDDLLNNLYKKSWIVHCAKSTPSPKLTIAYLGRYFKRPPIAESKLKHYDGSSVKFKYLDHATNQYRHFNLFVKEFISKFVQHIPDINFRMIRYYGFLANRVRGTLLPKIYNLLQQTIIKTPAISFATLMQKYFSVNPLQCILCGSSLALISIKFGKTNTTALLNAHQILARFSNL